MLFHTSGKVGNPEIGAMAGAHGRSAFDIGLELTQQALHGSIRPFKITVGHPYISIPAADSDISTGKRAPEGR